MAEYIGFGNGGTMLAARIEDDARNPISVQPRCLAMEE
eukprot:CAMPEP_0202063280 /NCGR_PEP_ID=MMETSP0963-20130614/46072_1 /ASSEMBLY_ACC=CAM_ASM_000494 /TAXON_ID=4773 /ORGANISM="Schizochytrium aggregatum, Strain ATCC28209" /LENGTH=37 /DNA_ID= /DNA_START= /DNA_END= /DNA_ORIENTATION=